MNVYALVLALISSGAARGERQPGPEERTKADYLVAGRTLPWYVLVFTLLSSWIGSGSLFAGAENAFQTASPRSGRGPAAAGLLVIFFIAPRARKFAQYTIPDLLETRYDVWARILGAAAISSPSPPSPRTSSRAAATSCTSSSPASTPSRARPSASTAGKEHVLGMVIIVVFVMLFTALAGMASVAYMDVVIGSLTTVAALLSVPFLLSRVGGWSGFHAALPPEYFQPFGKFGGAGGGFVRAMELLVPTMLLLMGNQSIYQKFFSARSERDARLSGSSGSAAPCCWRF